MAKQQSGENKQPLVIALVVSVLLLLGVGYLAYSKSEDASAARAEMAKAKSDEQTAQKLKDQEKEKGLVYKAALGILDENDRTALAGLRQKEDTRKAHAEMMKAIEDRAKAAIGGEASKFLGTKLNLKEGEVFQWKWEGTADAPPPVPKSLIDMAVTNYSQRQLAENSYNNQAASLKKAQEDIQKLVVTLDNAQKAIDTRTKEIPEEIAKGIKDARDQFEKFKIEFGSTMKEEQKKTSDLNDKLDQRSVQLKRQTEKSDQLQKSRDQIESELQAKIDPFQFDKPQGRVVRRTGQIVEIDIGSADNLRKGLTFSVMPADTASVGFETRMRTVRDADGRAIRRIVPKGSIEVVEVLGANLSQCRITEEDSQVRDRILDGDLIYNAMWRRGQSEHVVLYGIFDIDGDGRDDIRAIADELNRMGVIVDAYFDLSTLKWVGDVTSQTTFAVEGFSPTVSLADGNREGKARIVSAIADARKSVKDKGVRVIRPRDFFPRIGYKAKLDVSENAINQAATFYIRTLPADQGGAGETPKTDGK